MSPQINTQSPLFLVQKETSKTLKKGIRLIAPFISEKENWERRGAEEEKKKRKRGEGGTAAPAGPVTAAPDEILVLPPKHTPLSLPQSVFFFF